ncbi:LacI family transcriptional regulator [Parapedobacter pyrenivorans]|uniref:LacI family transcriptional regulator n=1 Tax=Parapedobacter pyrenivorans TaxID=1305674 RepID=A0A917HF50_9SPHI|nr:LacI family DNA-binding transcriptional regulator [Parapedobacter pyrenivorans]GGG77228.1 LacI family transcriptional regulator [Parapedobacter pyrenivorans]
MQKNRQTTIIDIAKQLGVSPSTVSRALHNHPSISAETKKNVLAMAEKHSYQPNLLALSLLNKKTGIIGIVVPEITSYFFATVISGVQDMVSSAGYKLLICQSNESFEEEKKLLQDMTLLRVDGVLISPTFRTKTFGHFERLQRAGIPMVIFDRDCPHFEADKVLVDSYDGAYQAVEYLIKTGCQHIAHIAGPIAFPTFKQRLDGYLNAHYDNNIPIRSELIVYSNGFSSDYGVDAAMQLMANNDRVDAIFAVNDAVAIGAICVIREKGYRVPEDISVVGFDDESYAQYYYPPLSTVWQPVYELGMLSAKIVLDHFASKEQRENYRYEVLKPELVIRESSISID